MATFANLEIKMSQELREALAGIKEAIEKINSDNREIKERLSKLEGKK